MQNSLLIGVAFVSVSVHVVVINANYLDPQSIFLFYIFYDVNATFFFLFRFPLLDIYTGASKLMNSIDLHFINYENSAENIKIDTDHETKFHWNKSVL